MNEHRVRQAPAQRFDVDSMVIDLPREIAALRSEPTPAQHGHRQKVLYKHGNCTVALFAMDAGSALPEHAAAGVVTIQPLEGDLRIAVNGVSHHMKAGTQLILAPGVQHDVQADSPAAFLLHVSLEP